MAIHLALQTKELITQMIEADQGSSFRGWLGKVIPHMDDAYREGEEPFRTHMGASLIGEECPRSIWYGWRWVTRPKFPARILRLFNRGHLEEARFIAMFLMIGCQVYQQDANGKQFRISHADGHFGGSGDGVAVGLPELNQGQPCLLEFKTHSEKSFTELVKKGVREAKPQHFVQMQVYLRKMGIAVALYGAVNKNTDEIHLEYVFLEGELADQYLERGVKLVWMNEPPTGISTSPGFFKCRWCNHRPACQMGAEPDVNCRTCAYSKPVPGAVWVCTLPANGDALGNPVVIDKARQFTGCTNYEKHGSL